MNPSSLVALFYLGPVCQSEKSVIYSFSKISHGFEFWNFFPRALGNPQHATYIPSEYFVYRIEGKRANSGSEIKIGDIGWQLGNN